MAAGDGSTLQIRVPGFPEPIQFNDWVHGGYYGTAEFTSGDTTELDIFSSGPGGQIPGGTRSLTKTDLNLNKAGVNGFDPGYQMLVYSLQAEIRRVAYTASTAALSDPSIGPNMATMQDAMDKLYSYFLYNQKTVVDGRICVFPQGKGIHLVTEVTGQELATNGQPNRMAQVEYVLPIWLKQNIGFNWFFNPVIALTISQAFVYSGSSYTGNYYDIQGRMEGLIMRPVR